MCGSGSVILFALAFALRRGEDRLLDDVGAYCCLAACLAGVAAGIFGAVTLARALGQRRSD